MAKDEQLEVQELFDPATSTLTYIVWDKSSKDACVVDPVWDFDPASGKLSEESARKIISFIHEKKLILHLILETHAHADHLSSAQILKKAFPRAKIGIGKRIKEVQKTFAEIFNSSVDFKSENSFFDSLFEDGENFTAGSLTGIFRSLPGHTPACGMYLIRGHAFVGDILFMPDSGTGRCDFSGGSAEALYDSVTQKIFSLPEETPLFVGHDYQPGGRGLQFRSTVKESKENNIHLRSNTSREEFVDFRRKRDSGLAVPRLLLPALQVNIRGGQLPPPEQNGKSYLKIPLVFSLLLAFFGTGAEAASPPIRIGSIRQPSCGLIELAESQNFFKAEGVSVEVIRYPLGKAAMESLLSDRVDLAAAYDTPVIRQLQRGVPLQVLTMLHRSSKNTAILTLQKNRIQKPSDLEGKKIGFPHNTSANYFFSLYIQRYGINPKKIQAVDVELAQLETALKAGKVDAVIAWNPFLEQMREHLETDKTNILFLDVYTEFSMLFGKEQTLKKYPEEIIKILSALLKAEDYFLKSPDGKLADICKVQGFQARICDKAYKDVEDFQLSLGLSNLFLTVLKSQADLLEKIDPFWTSERAPLKINFSSILDSKSLQKVCAECVTIIP